MIEDDYIILNLGENNPFILIFSKKIEEGNNNSDINIDNFFYKNLCYLSAPLKI